MRGVAIGSLAAGAAIVGVAIWVSQARPPERSARLIPGEQERLLVEVLNGTRIDGLARTVTRRLRSRGIDVVHFGTAPDSTVETTRIVVRRGDSTAALRVLEILGLGTVTDDPDERLLLDATVILGQDAAGLRGLEP